jgi:hypothetical protein
MTGPTIIAQAAPDQRAIRSRYEGQSGVRWNKETREWVAIKNGRYEGSFRGKRGFLAATRAAGSTARLA